ncbi:diguanylate cyclase domain-containing protein, partial [Marinobacter santoriniensis NKSG1]
MKWVVDPEIDIINDASDKTDQPLTRRSPRAWAIQLAGCRLCRNLTFAAFAAILVIEVAILIPSYRNYEEGLLQSRVDIVSQAIVTLIKAAQGQDVPESALESLLTSSPLTGVSLRRNGTEYRVGEAIDTSYPADGLLRAAPRTSKGTIDLAWRSDVRFSGYEVLARIDVSNVPSKLVAFVFRILGLSLLIAVFVTAVTMFVIDRMMLSPLLRLRDRISRAGEDAEHPLEYLTPAGRSDEFGQVERVFNSLLKQNAAYLARLKRLNQELDQLLEARTRTLRKTEKELEIRTLYDQLTGLANRSLFEEQLNSHFGSSEHSRGKEAVLVLGLNDFQTLNGLAGHETGDRVLQEIARRVAGFSADHGRVARLGGDVFGLLVEERARTPIDLEARISTVIESCQRPIQIGRKTFEFEFSAGVAISGLDGQDARTLLSHA